MKIMNKGMSIKLSLADYLDNTFILILLIRGTYNNGKFFDMKTTSKANSIETKIN